ncbi:hypothetical protein JX265_006156 [Neoarthrinium moseri]|uniref:Hydrophobin n=1 Tax=Neoarthrinium moseri TaxID=1658444 RepID=A0A9P9WML5_9PEZI|nr:hypothetical protein JX265_006156 [Neoarthrinium moseri]
MQFSTPLALLAPFLPTLLAAPNPYPAPAPDEAFDFDDIGDAFKDAFSDENKGQLLSQLEDIGDDVKEAASGAWGKKVDDCLVVQCAAALGPTVVTCVTSELISPLPCIAGVLTTISDSPSECDGCPQAVAKAVKNED